VAEALTERVTTAGDPESSHAISASVAAEIPKTSAAPRNEMASIICSDDDHAALVPT
jgi:hypothetical protein